MLIQIFLSAGVGVNPSYMWRSILESHEAVRNGCRRKIGDGKETWIWGSPWLPFENNGLLTSPMNRELEKGLVEGLMVEDHSSWDRDIVNELCNERDRDLILQVPLTSSHKVNSWYWLLDSKGEFTVKVATDV